MMPGAVLRSARMGRQTKMDRLWTMETYGLVGFPADFDSDPVPEVET